MRMLAATAVAIAIAANTLAATQTYVSLGGRNDDVPKLGRPGIAVHVEAVTQDEAIVVTNEVQRELARLVHTRSLSAGEPGDYELKVLIDVTIREGEVAKIPFAATLTSPDGVGLWRIDGRSETTEPAAAPSVYVSIGRNVISALIHDGWLQPRFDPNDPPPNPPQIRTDDSTH